LTTRAITTSGGMPGLGCDLGEEAGGSVLTPRA